MLTFTSTLHLIYESMNKCYSVISELGMCLFLYVLFLFVCLLESRLHSAWAPTSRRSCSGAMDRWPGVWGKICGSSCYPHVPGKTFYSPRNLCLLVSKITQKTIECKIPVSHHCSEIHTCIGDWVCYHLTKWDNRRIMEIYHWKPYL